MAFVVIAWLQSGVRRNGSKIVFRCSPSFACRMLRADGLADRLVDVFDKANCESYADLAEQLFSLEEHRGWNVQWLLY
jgi:hypothetical protein